MTFSTTESVSILYNDYVIRDGWLMLGNSHSVINSVINGGYCFKYNGILLQEVINLYEYRLVKEYHSGFLYTHSLDGCL